MKQNSALLNPEPEANTIEFDEKILITGPSQMMSKLVGHFPDFVKTDVLFIWLNSEDCAQAIEQLTIPNLAEGKISPSPSLDGERQKLIVVCRSNDKESALKLSESLDLTSTRPLDVLVVADGKWWSSLCSDTDCCPPDGRLLPTKTLLSADDLSDRHATWFRWLSLYNKFQTESDLIIGTVEAGELKNTLDDLAIRDCLLNHLAINVESQATWINIFELLLTSENKTNNHVIYCLLAAINFSISDTTKADFYTKQSLLINPTYSLSLLMQHGLEIEMDTKKVVAAFTHFSAEELLKNTPARKSV